MKKTNSIKKEVAASVKSISLDTGKAIGEALLDRFMEDEIIRSIPVLGTAIAIVKSGLGIREQLFLNKLRSFWDEIESVPKVELRKFISRHFNDSKKENDLGEKILHLMDKIDSEKKAKLVGRAFRLFIQNKIDSILFYDLLHVIESFNLHYLDHFLYTVINLEQIQLEFRERNTHFHNCGLIFQPIETRVFIYRESEKKYSKDELTEAGKVFISEILEENQPEIKEKLITKFCGMDTGSLITAERKIIRQINNIEFRDYLNSLTLPELLDMKFRGSNILAPKQKDYKEIVRNSNVRGNYFLK
ncbi:MAG: hypothetical protein H6581_17520 [Bacteroidia bacterium]|nr:hypothetical protein [Bacteroidia bacterium]